MKDLKHTQGEWTIDNRITNGTEGYEIHYNEDGECITDHVYTLADAKLIAAAPDLLDALNKLIEANTNNKGESVMNVVDFAKKAIKKATE